MDDRDGREHESALAALEQTVEAARALYNDIVARGHPAHDCSMRSRTVCPGCTGRQLIYATEVLDRAQGFSRSKMALTQPSGWRLKGAGHFEAWICVGCGLVEWYIHDVGAVMVDGVTLRLVPAEDMADAPRQLLGGLSSPGQLGQTARRLEDAHQLATELGARLERLQAHLLGERGVLDRTMRSRRRCLSCGGRDLLYAAAVVDRADGMARPAMALEQPSVWRQAGVGQFVAWICRGCGVVEWYVPDLSGVSIDGDRRRVLEGERAAQGAPEVLAVPAPLGADRGDADLERWLLALSRCADQINARLRGLHHAALAPAAPASLSQRLRCPACGASEVLHARVILDRSEGGRDNMALVQPRLLRLEGKGTFAAWICTGCGLVEWRVPDIAEVTPDGKKLRRVEGVPAGSGPDGPYR